MAREGRPRKIYSDNGKTFIATASWLKKIMRQEQFQNFLAYQNTIWQFNLRDVKDYYIRAFEVHANLW